MPHLPHSIQKLKIGFSRLQINIVLFVQQIDFISFFNFIFNSDMHSLEDFCLFLCICENSQVDFFSPFSLLKFYKSLSQKKSIFCHKQTV